MRDVPLELFKVDVKNKISKDKTLEEVENSITREELKLSYDNYVAPMITWVTGDLKRIAKVLDVLRVVPMGGYIRGLLGGEKKKGKQEYAGLVVEHYEEDNGIIYVKLYNLRKSYQIPADLLKRLEVNIYKLYYMGLINPFSCRTYDVLLSARGDEELKKFLRTIIDVNQGVMDTDDINYLNTLINELKTSIDMFKEDYYYVVYRRNRVFTACVVEKPKNAISSDVVSYIECRNAEQAYYYAAVLNYLAYKAVETGRAFIRSQFARPAMAVAIAGLSWSTIPEDARTHIASLSTQLSRKITWKRYPNQRIALEDLFKYKEFNEITQILDKLVDKEKLGEALNLVSTKDEEEPEED